MSGFPVRAPDPAPPHRGRSGWYPDPWRQAPYRWWDGTGWTPTLWNASPAAYDAYRRSEVQQPLAPDAPVTGPSIWIVALLPLLDLLAVVLWRADLIEFQFGRIGTIGDPARALEQLQEALTSGWLLGTSIVGIVGYAGAITFSALDARMLRRSGYARPFPWPWSFLYAGIYVIGRSVKVHSATGRGVAPLWVWAALQLSVWVAVVVTALLTAGSALPAQP